MAKQARASLVKGGSVLRDAATGQLMEVRTAAGVSRASPKTEAVVKETAAKRKEALRRLADR